MSWKEILTEDQIKVLDSYENPRLDDLIHLMSLLNLDIKIIAEFYKDRIEKGIFNK